MLNLNVSAVSHQVANLESFVERQLFDSSPRGLTLTMHGERFHRDVTGALTGLWLMPRLPAFRAGIRSCAFNSMPHTARLTLLVERPTSPFVMGPCASGRRYIGLILIIQTAQWCLHPLSGSSEASEETHAEQGVLHHSQNLGPT